MVVCSFVLFRLAIVVYVIPRYTDSECPFVIFKLILCICDILRNKENIDSIYKNDIQFVCASIWCVWSVALRKLFVICIYVYWGQQFKYHMIYVSFNSNTTCANSGTEVCGEPVFTPVLYDVRVTISLVFGVVRRCLLFSVRICTFFFLLLYCRYTYSN